MQEFRKRAYSLIEAKDFIKAMQMLGMSNVKAIACGDWMSGRDIVFTGGNVVITSIGRTSVKARVDGQITSMKMCAGNGGSSIIVEGRF
jgi:hypothetical protein